VIFFSLAQGLLLIQILFSNSCRMQSFPVHDTAIDLDA
jgi:hypothetical protein